MEIYYVTSNEGKFEEAQYILEGWKLNRINIDLIEIQGEVEEIVREKAKEALRRHPYPLIVEDVSMHCPALQGLPGPYVKEFLLKLGARGLYELVYKYTDHRAQVICTAAYIEPGQDPLLFQGVMHGTLVAPIGNIQHGLVSWNPIFLPEGMSKTFGELSIKEHSLISMRAIALKKLRDHLQKK